MQPLLYDTVEEPLRPSNVEQITVTIWGDIWGNPITQKGGGGHMVSASYSTDTNTCTHTHTHTHTHTNTHTQQYYINWAGEVPSMSPLNSKPCQCIEVTEHSIILSLIMTPTPPPLVWGTFCILLGDPLRSTGPHDKSYNFIVAHVGQVIELATHNNDFIVNIHQKVCIQYIPHSLQLE